MPPSGDESRHPLVFVGGDGGTQRRVETGHRKIIRAAREESPNFFFFFFNLENSEKGTDGENLAEGITVPTNSSYPSFCRNLGLV